jgi:putative nucleotidyltransferase with HDIG domain
MKAGKKGIGEDTVDINNITANSEIRDRKINHSILITLLPILSMIAAILPGILWKTPGIEIAKVAVLIMILTTVATFYIRLYSETILNKRLAKTVITLSYLCSILLLLVVPKPYLYGLWMLGGLFVAMVIDNRLGLLFHFSLSFILGITCELQPEIIIYILIIGVIMNLLSGTLRSRSTVIYGMIIVLSMNVTLSFIINNFVFDSQENYNYLYSLFSMLAVLVAAFLLSVLYDSRTAGTSEQQLEPLEEWAGGRQSDTNAADNREPVYDALAPEISIQSLAVKELTASAFQDLSKEEGALDLDRIIGTRSSYDVLCSPENELVMRLKAYSETLYGHALLVAEISGRAAKQIGAVEQLAYAGGMYHEIGKIGGKNYIEEGLIIAEDYAFPKELKAIIKEHNIKYDKPGSVEAAIVMLTDNVVSTIDYISKTEDRKFTPEKIIDNIFQMRMDKGTFDQSGLSLKDFKLLKEFYLNEFMNEK